MINSNPKNNPISISEPNGVRRTVQIVGIADGYGNGMKANGRQTGTLFGDNIIVASRFAVSSGKYSQGLPLHAANYNIVGSGYWQVVNDTGLNGACEFGTGTDVDGKFYVQSKVLNRYQEGFLSYYLFTALWSGVENATGDFVALIGASISGLAVDGQGADIKEGFMFGWVRESGILKPIIRKYKGFSYTDYECIPPACDCRYFNIFEMQIGYLGIHPFLLYMVNSTQMKQELLAQIDFQTQTTTVNDPNMAISVYVENKGNNTNIAIRNGSFQFGNIQSIPRTSDAASRICIDNYVGEDIDRGTDTVIGIYTVLDKVQMHSRVDSSGTTQATFRNTVRNKLKKIIGVAESKGNKFISLSVYLVPITAVTGATWTAINPYVNILYKSTVGTVDLTNAVKLVELPELRSGNSEDLSNEEVGLDGSMAGIITVTSKDDIEDLRYTIITEDLF